MSTVAFGAPLPADAPRRMSEVKRKPVPKLSEEELRSLTSACSTSSSLSLSTPPLQSASHPLDVDYPSVNDNYRFPWSAIPLPGASATQAKHTMNAPFSFSTAAARPNAQISLPSPPLSPSSTRPRGMTAKSSPFIPREVQEDCGCGALHSVSETAEDGKGRSSSEYDDAALEASQEALRQVRISAYDWTTPSSSGVRMSSPLTDSPAMSEREMAALAEETGFDSAPRSSVSSFASTATESESIFDHDEDEYDYRGIHRFGSTSSTSSAGSNVDPEVRRAAMAAKLEQVLSHSDSSAPTVTVPRKLSAVMTELLESINKPKSRAKPFSTYEKPSVEAMQAAADSFVYREDGEMVRFGDMWENQRTIVCFIRHYWCPSCQDYMASMMRVTPEQMRQLNLKVVIVGCGNYKMIPGYRKLLGGCEYDIVSDPTRSIYKLFGMTRTSLSPGRRGSYIQAGMAVNTAKSLKRNMAMPLKDPGSLAGLGGEFVVGPGMECTFAHRMSATRDHAELQDILKAIGCILPAAFLQQEQENEARLRKQRQNRRIYSTPTHSGRYVIKVMDNPNLPDIGEERERRESVL